METKKRMTRKLDLLTAVEQVVELSKGSRLDAEFFKKAAHPLKHLSERLEMTKEQSVMMALFIDNSNDTSIRNSDFSRHLECSTTRVIRLMSDIEELERRGLVCCRRDESDISYRVPWEVVEAFKRNEKYTPRDYSGLNCSELFNVIEEIMKMRKDKELSTEVAIMRLQQLMDGNNHLLFVQKLKSFNLYEKDEMLLLLFSHLFVNNNDDNIGYHDLNFFFDCPMQWSLIKGRLNKNSHILQETKMIEFNNDEGFVNRESFRMTWAAKQALFSELNLVSMNQDRKNVIKHEEIVQKQLYYDKAVASQVSDLGQLLEESHYNDVCSRLKDKGYRSGFTCLFYGAPGTGKTETVLQLARQTGRDIMQVNISEIKSMWVGESEKNIKKVFEQYRMKVETSTIAPILLFNEADAIIGKRQEGAERAVEKMENSIQNIILQEMETLNGILIATTNLAQNMDKAFERRFLYKIKFNKPTLEARMQIWHSMLPELQESDIRALAEKYDFSGGQIENIARHYAIDSILHSDSAASLEKLMEHCDSERLEQKESRKIGFK
ncbi:MAG: ATP-binding protein [Bacteroidales bacterium]|nr:ATP-binding protein [Bacteroidales bacterium]